MTSTTRVLISSSENVSSRLVYGTFAERRDEPRGTVLSFSPHEVVFYAVKTVKCRSFVFRTLQTPERFATEVPGVSPAVRLLLDTRTIGRLERLEQLLRYLARKGSSPASLSDAFYLRLHAVLSGRLPASGKVIRSLLEQEAGNPHPA